MTNPDIHNIVTPVNWKLLQKLLIQAHYDQTEIDYLVNGFKDGFSLEYEGPLERKDCSQNIPLQAHIGDESDLWDKMMKEVSHKRFAGPFNHIPFEWFVQSPVGLVPKAGGFKSINHYIPRSKCTVKYRDLDHAIQQCLRLLRDNPDVQLWLGVSDLKSAFRLVPLQRRWWKFLVMKARDPKTREWRFFVDKCFPFGAAISCTIFQRVSNALTHLTHH